MNKTQVTSQRGRNLRVLIIVVCVLTIISALPLRAQNENRNQAAANLRIHVHVVPVILHHHEPKHEPMDRDGLVFSVPGDGLKTNVTEEERVLSEQESRTLLDGKSGTVVLKTQTIVLP